MEKISMFILLAYLPALSLGYSYYYGCYSSGSGGLIFEFIDGQMTIEKCVQRCYAKYHVYSAIRQGTSCFCGDCDTAFVETDGSVCNQDCPGKSSDKCGGSLGYSIYKKLPYDYKGCYKDMYRRLLPHEYVSENHMTVELCVDQCNAMAYAYAGLENGRQCFCGNELHTDCYGKQKESECSSPCAGNYHENCGGKWRLSAYKTLEGRYRGCYKSGLLANRILNLAYMSNALCNYKCGQHGYRFSAIQDRSQCFCGNNMLRSGFGRYSDSHCNKPCYGTIIGYASRRKCGGSYRLSVYSTNKEFHVGCFEDEHGSLLHRHCFTHGKMTRDYCIQTCKYKHYKFAGVKNGNKCCCGNVIPGGYTLKNDECTTKCSGDHSQYCGGDNWIEVYESGINFAKYLGCFIDTSNRILDGRKYVDNQMSVAKCTSICAKEGYSYAGVEFRTECFCGHEMRYYTRVGDCECSYNCGGNYYDKCGAVWRINIYRVKPEKGYKGCYNNNQGNFFQNLPSALNPSIIRCRQECHTKKAPYAGLQETSCSCGKIADINNPGNGRVHDNYCSALCTDNNYRICGDSSYVSVYLSDQCEA